MIRDRKWVDRELEWNKHKRKTESALGIKRNGVWCMEVADDNKEVANAVVKHNERRRTVQWG